MFIKKCIAKFILWATKEQYDLLKSGIDEINKENLALIQKNIVAENKIQLLWEWIVWFEKHKESLDKGSFLDRFKYHIASGNFQEFYDNYDVIFTNNDEIKKWIESVKQDFTSNINNCLNRVGSEKLKNWDSAFELLSDEESKDLFVRLLAWRLLGFTKIKIISDSIISKDVEIYNRLNKSIISQEMIKDVKFELKCYDLNLIGYPILCFAIPESIIMDYVRLQYENDFVKLNDGDIVLDCGGCWGDTALLFADRVGAQGKVFSFEFVPSNIEIFKKNISLNPTYKNIISIVNFAVGSESGKTLEFIDDGTATSIAIEKNLSGRIQKTQTCTIDDFVEKERLNKVDFIKMDIEGAEISALQGATKTIRKFKPKLAISIYHKDDDIWQIPCMIKDMYPEYNMYIKHNTKSSLETVLLCKIK